MTDSFTKTESTGFFSRLMSSFVGVLIGILMIPGSVILLSWNEYRTIHRTRGLNEAAQVVQSVNQIDTIDNGLKDKLIHLTGKAEPRSDISDELLPIPQRLIHLRRDVEMYQWVEEVETHTKEKIGGGKETSKVYTYRKEWHSGRVASEQFEKRQGHENPALVFAPQTTTADKVFVGAYPLNADLIDSIDDYEALSLAQLSLEQLPVSRGGSFTVRGNELYWSQNNRSSAKVPTAPPTVTNADSSGTAASGPSAPNGETVSGTQQAEAEVPGTHAASAAPPTTQTTENSDRSSANRESPPSEPQLGDLRISFRGVAPMVVSFVSAWKGDRFEPYITSNQEPVERLYLGEKTAAEVFAGLQAENTMFAWLLRLGGFVLCGIGFSLILGPLSAIAAIIPFFGKLTRWLVGMISMLLAVIVSSSTIAIAWIAVRPVLGISLLAVAAIGLYALTRLRKSSGDAGVPTAEMGR